MSQASKSPDPDVDTAPDTKRTKVALNPNDFDVFGFDMDLTLVDYHTAYLLEWVYTGLQNHLVEECGFSREIFLPISQIEHMFFRGVTMDVDKGTILQVDKDGVIAHAFYGLKPLTREEIVEIYGEGKWGEWHGAFQEHLQGAYPDTNKQTDDTTRTIYTFDSEFDTPGSGVFACVVESIVNSEQKSENLKERFNAVWKDVGRGFSSLYTFNPAAVSKNAFYNQCKQKPEDFIKKIAPKTIECIKGLKAEGKCVFLLTTSNYDYTDGILKVAYGDGWRELFTVVLTHARKPGFFFSKGQLLCRVYLDEGKLEACDSIETGGLYTGGNADHLNKFLSRFTKKERPTVLYVGDNLRADVHGASRLPDWKCACLINNLPCTLEIDSKKKSESGEFVDKFVPNSHISTRNGNNSFWFEKMLSLCYLLAPNIDSICEVLSGDMKVEDSAHVLKGYSI